MVNIHTSYQYHYWNICIGTYVYSHSPLNKTRHFLDQLVNHGKSSLNNYLDPPNTHEKLAKSKKQWIYDIL